jgi:hypothetical protein
MARATILLAAFLLSGLRPSYAAEADRFTAELFQGGDLSGWKATGCEVNVHGGTLLLKSGNGFIHSPYRYADFVLELDWRPLKDAKWDSGVYIRSELPAHGKPWPSRYQINLKQGEEGNLLGIAGATSKGLVKSGEWNHLKITVVGDRAEVEINGQPAWKASGLEPKDGFIGFQAEVDEGGEFEFRDVKVTELGYKPLFNGKDLSGWQGAVNGYAAENGLLVCRKEGGGNLYTDKEYSDFSVRFEVKMEPGGNNGLGIRAPLMGDAAYVGMEIQILDDYSDLYKDIRPYQHHGSVYGIVPAKQGHLNRAGQWNYEEVIARGRQITVNLNGATIVDANLDEASKPRTIDGNQHPGLSRSSGYIGFLGHGAQIEFRNIRLQDLSAGTSVGQQ